MKYVSIIIGIVIFIGSFLLAVNITEYNRMLSDMISIFGMGIGAGLIAGGIIYGK